MAEEIPLEVVIDILSSLPTKSLLRFRCVCKAWRDVISNDSFIKLHLSRKIERDDLTLLTSELEPCDESDFAYEMSDDYYTEIYCLEGSSFTMEAKVEFPFKTYYEDFMVVGSCNGIVCIVKGCDVCLLNPYTREYKIVEFKKCFVLDNRDGDSYGFAYDASSKDYKLVHCVNYSGHNSKIKMYSLNDAACHEVKNVPYKISNVGESGVLLHGDLHWVADRSSKLSITIIALKVEEMGRGRENVCRVVPTPEDVDNEINYIDCGISVGVMRGKLSMLCNHKTSGEIEIWMMNQYGVRNSWSKVYTIEDKVVSSICSSARDSPSLDDSNLRVLCLTKKGEVLLIDSTVLVLYDPKKKTAERLDILGRPGWAESDKTVTLVASLVPLGSGNYMRETM